MQALFWSIMRIGAAVYIGWCLLVFFRQSSFLYYPDRIVGLTPSYMDMAYEDVVLSTEDGERLGAWFVFAGDGPSAAPTVLFCHGNAGDIGDRLDSIRNFRAMGFHVFIFDYRGYGDSSGKPTEEGTYLDAKAAWLYLTRERGIAQSDILVFGRSLGGAVAVYLADEFDPAALFIESTFTSVPDMAARVFPLLPARLLCRFRYHSLERIGRVSCPVVIAHSPNDEMIPYAHGQRLFAAAPDPKLFLDMQGKHNDAVVSAGTEAAGRVLGFLSEHASLGTMRSRAAEVPEASGSGMEDGS